jgi:hypothetical protein
MIRCMKSTRRVFARSVVAASLLAKARSAEVISGRRTVVLRSPAATLLIDLGGGSIVDFHLSENGLNPLRWIGPADQNAALRPMAHFLCLDRWGQPSEAERKAGMPFHGEASRVEWKELDAGENRGVHTRTAMSAKLPIAGLEIRRDVVLSPAAGVFTVSETVNNLNKLGRLYNMVQHATIGPPFLDESTVVDSNAQRGLMQSSPLPNPEKPEVRWPQAIGKSGTVDLRRLTDDPDPAVVSFVVDDEMGWVTATNASKELLLGYLFRTAEYPWLNIWRHVQDGKPLARGLEFGTTGLHQPFHVLISKPQIFGKPTFAYLDAAEAVTRRYTAFLTKVPRDFAGVQKIAHGAGTILIQERGGKGREITITDGLR